MKYLKTIYLYSVARSLWQRAVTMMKTPHQEL